MATKITAKKTGSVIKHLRAEKGVSQEQLAQVLGVPRSAISLMESGSRELSFDEFQQLLSFFQLGYEEFVNSYKSRNALQHQDTESLNAKIPFHPDRLKELLLYILGVCGGRPNVGETVLYKLLYFCDFDYFEKYGKPLTGMKYKRMQFGPVPMQREFQAVLKSLMQAGDVERMTRPYKGKTMQTRYIAFREPNLRLFAEDLPDVLQVVDAVIARLGSMSAVQIEEYSHRDYPWIAHKDGEEIDYSSVLQRSAEFAQRDHERDFVLSSGSDIIASLPQQSEEEYDYYMSLPDKTCS